MVEKPAVEEAPSRLAVLGRYVITPEIFSIMEHTEPGRGGEIQLTDALKVLAKEQAMLLAVATTWAISKAIWKQR